MPTTDSILSGLTAIAHDAIALAIGWHVVIGVALVALARGVRPTKRKAALFLVAPLVSVGLLAGAYGNLFNAVVFSVVSVALFFLARRLPTELLGRVPAPVAIAGAGLLAFGWVYPHFLDDLSPFVYLFAAPVGLLPCPTLSVAIGFSLLVGGFGSRAWSAVLSATGLFYGFFGAFRLGVSIDLVLAVGALLLPFSVAGRATRTGLSPRVSSTAPASHPEPTNQAAAPHRAAASLTESG